MYLPPFADFIHALPPEEQAKEWYRRKLARIVDKENNMRNRVERRRHAIWWKWTTRLSWFCFFMVALPLSIALVNWCWWLVQISL
jgi:hypothetical protein